MKIAIIGAGLSGIMAANYFISKGYDVDIFDKEKPFDIHHVGVLRFKNHEVGNFLGCNYKQIEITKAYYYGEALYNVSDIRMNNLYSFKVTGEFHNRSILKNKNDNKRYILTDSPKPLKNINFEKEIKEIYSIKESESVLSFVGSNKIKIYNFIISTLPMYLNLSLTKTYTKIRFVGKPIHTVEFEIPFESTVNQTVYLVDVKSPIYRITLQGKKILIESIDNIVEKEIYNVLYMFFGEVSWKITYKDIEKSLKEKQNPCGKIIPIEDTLRRNFIVSLTQKYNIFSLGRYAIWKPGLMLDGVITDIKQIDKMINMDKMRREYESYNYKLH